MTNGSTVRVSASPRRARERPAQAAAVLAVDPPPHVGAAIVGQRRRARGEHAHVSHVHLEVLQSGRAEQGDREPDDLDVGGEVALAQQLGADL